MTPLLPSQLALTTTDTLFRSSSPLTPSRYLPNEDEDDDDDQEYFRNNPITTPFIGHDHRLRYPEERGEAEDDDDDTINSSNQIPEILAVVASALRKSLLVTCSVEQEDFSSMDIGYPTDTRHVSHVTFHPFHGFLGLPLDLLPQLPPKVPSASVSVFGVSANSMQCSYDQRGNSVPTILLMLQKRLYSGGGLQVEGIFRINAENTKEESVRNQLNKGLVPHGIDVHCLAGLIKAWFRELPIGVLDSLTAEQVMHCNTEDECTQLLARLPPTEAALLDWAINLMADVVQYEHLNKMNARNVAMVFAPNMTQMADPLTALSHAVQVMNLLKTLVVKAVQEKEDPNATTELLLSLTDSPSSKDEAHISSSNLSEANCGHKEPGDTNILRRSTIRRLECEKEENLRNFKNDNEKECNHDDSLSMSGRTSPGTCNNDSLENVCRGGSDADREAQGILSRLSITKGVKRLCKHPLCQLNKVVRKSGNLGIVNARVGGGEAWT